MLTIPLISRASEDYLYRNDEYHFRIKFPTGWEIKDGDGQYIIKKAVKDGGTVLVLVNNDFIKAGLTKEEKGIVSDKDIESMELSILSDEEVNTFLETIISGQLESFPGSTILEKGIRYIDNRKAAYFKMNQVYNVQNVRVEGISINYFTIHKGKLYQIGGMYPTVPISEKDKEPTINESLSTFVFEDWNDPTGITGTKNTSEDTKEASFYDLFSKKSWGALAIVLIVSILFTWGFGLLIPILFRFVFIKRPLSKAISFLVVFILWLIQLIIYTSLDSKSKTHNALVLVAIVSYWILRVGAPKKIKNAEINQQENKVNENAEIIRYCKECGNQINASATNCINCGKEISKKN